MSPLKLRLIASFPPPSQNEPLPTIGLELLNITPFSFSPFSDDNFLYIVEEVIFIKMSELPQALFRPSPFFLGYSFSPPPVD